MMRRGSATSNKKDKPSTSFALHAQPKKIKVNKPRTWLKVFYRKTSPSLSGAALRELAGVPSSPKSEKVRQKDNTTIGERGRGIVYSPFSSSAQQLRGNRKLDARGRQQGDGNDEGSPMQTQQRQGEQDKNSDEAVEELLSLFLHAQHSPPPEQAASHEPKVQKQNDLHFDNSSPPFSLVHSRTSPPSLLPLQPQESNFPWSVSPAGTGGYSPTNMPSFRWRILPISSEPLPMIPPYDDSSARTPSGEAGKRELVIFDSELRGLLLVALYDVLLFILALLCWLRLRCYRADYICSINRAVFRSATVPFGSSSSTNLQAATPGAAAALPLALAAADSTQEHGVAGELDDSGAVKPLQHVSSEKQVAEVYGAAAAAATYEGSGRGVARQPGATASPSFVTTADPARVADAAGKAVETTKVKKAIIDTERRKQQQQQAVLHAESQKEQQQQHKRRAEGHGEPKSGEAWMSPAVLEIQAGQAETAAIAAAEEAAAAYEAADAAAAAEGKEAGAAMAAELHAGDAAAAAEETAAAADAAAAAAERAIEERRRNFFRRCTCTPSGAKRWLLWPYRACKALPKDTIRNFSVLREVYRQLNSPFALAHSISCANRRKRYRRKRKKLLLETRERAASSSAAIGRGSGYNISRVKDSDFAEAEREGGAAAAGRRSGSRETDTSASGRESEEEIGELQLHQQQQMQTGRDAYDINKKKQHKLLQQVEKVGSTDAGKAGRRRRIFEPLRRVRRGDKNNRSGAEELAPAPTCTGSSLALPTQVGADREEERGSARELFSFSSLSTANPPSSPQQRHYDPSTASALGLASRSSTSRSSRKASSNVDQLKTTATAAPVHDDSSMIAESRLQRAAGDSCSADDDAVSKLQQSQQKHGSEEEGDRVAEAKHFGFAGKTRSRRTSYHPKEAADDLFWWEAADVELDCLRGDIACYLHFLRTLSWCCKVIGLVGLLVLTPLYLATPHQTSTKSDYYTLLDLFSAAEKSATYALWIMLAACWTFSAVVYYAAYSLWHYLQAIRTRPASLLMMLWATHTTDTESAGRSFFSQCAAAAAALLPHPAPPSFAFSFGAPAGAASTCPHPTKPQYPPQPSSSASHHAQISAVTADSLTSPAAGVAAADLLPRTPSPRWAAAAVSPTGDRPTGGDASATAAAGAVASPSLSRAAHAPPAVPAGASNAVAAGSALAGRVGSAADAGEGGDGTGLGASRRREFAEELSGQSTLNRLKRYSPAHSRSSSSSRGCNSSWCSSGDLSGRERIGAVATHAEAEHAAEAVTAERRCFGAAAAAAAAGREGSGIEKEEPVARTTVVRRRSSSLSGRGADYREKRNSCNGMAGPLRAQGFSVLLYRVNRIFADPLVFQRTFVDIHQQFCSVCSASRGGSRWRRFLVLQRQREQKEQGRSDHHSQRLNSGSRAFAPLLTMRGREAQTSSSRISTSGQVLPEEDAAAAAAAALRQRAGKKRSVLDVFSPKRATSLPQLLRQSQQLSHRGALGADGTLAKVSLPSSATAEQLQQVLLLRDREASAAAIGGGCSFCSRSNSGEDLRVFYCSADEAEHQHQRRERVMSDAYIEGSSVQNGCTCVLNVLLVLHGNEYTCVNWARKETDSYFSRAQSTCLAAKHQQRQQERQQQRQQELMSPIVSSTSHISDREESRPLETPVKNSGVAIVTFDNHICVNEVLHNISKYRLLSKTAATTERRFAAFANIKAMHAPAAADIQWNNLSLTPLNRMLRVVGLNALLVILCLTIISPVLILDELTPIIDSIEAQLKEQRISRLTLTAWIPPLILVVINSYVQPLLIAYVAYFSGFWKKSHEAAYVLHGNISFQIFNTIVIPLLSLSSIESVLRLMYSSEITNWSVLLGYSLVHSSGSFAMRYLLNLALLGTASELLQLYSLIASKVDSVCFKTKQQRKYPFDIGYAYAQTLSVFTLLLLFSVVLPLLLPLGLLFFCCRYYVDKYNYVYHVHSDLGFESDGKLVATAIKYILFSVSFMQFAMGGFFLSQQQSPSLVIAGALTLFIALMCWILLCIFPIVAPGSAAQQQEEESSAYMEVLLPRERRELKEAYRQPCGSKAHCNCHYYF